MRNTGNKASYYGYRAILLAIVWVLTACSQITAANSQWLAPQPSTLPAQGTMLPATVEVLQPLVVKPDATSSGEPYPLPGSSATLAPSPSATRRAPTPTRLSPEDWKKLPIIPSTVSQTARTIYQRGIKMGNNPHAFSKIGDCQSVTVFFLGNFDKPDFYNLGPYEDLQETIDWYAGSFSRESLAVKGGFNAAAILSPLRADPSQCNSDENPVACELRLNRPSVAIISLEEWWAGHPENYDKYMRQILDYVISQGVVPIIATKADNLEGNNLINQTIADLAQEYDIPLWNFWASVQGLDNHGLMAYDPFGEVDMFHLTHSQGYYFYNDPSGTDSGWSMRNLTALEALDAVRRALAEQP